MADRNWQSYYGDNPDTSGFENPPDPQNYDDILKFSNCTHVVVNGKVVEAGNENCVDAVRGAGYTFTGCKLQDGAGIATVTLKGAIDHWTFADCTIGKGYETDIELGQFDDYWHVGRAPTRNGMILNCDSTSGPIRVTCWDAERPAVSGSNVQITKIPWIIWFPYFCFRWLEKKLRD